MNKFTVDNDYDFKPIFVSYDYEKVFSENKGRISRYILQTFFITHMKNYAFASMINMDTNNVEFYRIGLLISEDKSKLIPHFQKIPESEYNEGIYNVRFTSIGMVTQNQPKWLIPIVPMEIHIGRYFDIYNRDSYYIFTKGESCLTVNRNLFVNLNYPKNENVDFFVPNPKLFTSDTKFIDNPVFSILTFNPIYFSKWGYTTYTERFGINGGSVETWNPDIDGDLYVIFHSSEIYKRMEKLPKVYYSLKDLMGENPHFPEHSYVVKVTQSELPMNEGDKQNLVYVFKLQTT